MVVFTAVYQIFLVFYLLVWLSFPTTWRDRMCPWFASAVIISRSSLKHFWAKFWELVYNSSHFLFPALMIMEIWGKIGSLSAWVSEQPQGAKITTDPQWTHSVRETKTLCYIPLRFWGYLLPQPILIRIPKGYRAEWLRVRIWSPISWVVTHWAGISCI